MRFPMFVELAGRRVVVAGAGAVGERRILALLEHGAAVSVTAPEVSEKIALLSQKGALTLARRRAVKEDFEGAFFAVAATDDREVNHRIYQWCKELSVPVNVADNQEECDFYFPGIARRGFLSAGVCADGKDHRLVRKATEEIRILFEKYDSGQEGK